MPVVRQVRWAALLPQVLAIAALALMIQAVAPQSQWSVSIFIAALTYMILCRVLRSLLARDHIAGMRAYRAQRFEEAILHFEASYRFFSRHPRLDAFRSLLFGAASQDPYRVMALCNAACCYGQTGRGDMAIQRYEQALQEAPDCLLARTSLNMLRST